MKLIKISAVCSKGKVREENQDMIYIQGIEEDCGIRSTNIRKTFESLGSENIAVFDGMGGEECGGTASEIAKNVFMENCRSGSTLEDICLLINKKICEYMKDNQIFRMGSTAVMASIDDRIRFCNIGDSRIYKLSESGIEQLSENHITFIGRYGKRKFLNQHLGIPEEEMLIEPYSGETDYTDGDIFILCSDGLTDMVDEEKILQIALNCETEQLAYNLFDEAMNSGGKDNISIIAFSVAE